MDPIEKIEKALDSLVQKNVIISYEIDEKTSNNMSGRGIVIHISNSVQKQRKIVYNKKTFVNEHFTGNKKVHIQEIYLTVTSSTKIEEIEKIVKNELSKYQVSEWAENEALKLFEKYEKERLIKSFEKASDNIDVTEGYDFKVILFDQDRIVYFDVTLNQKKGKHKIKIHKNKKEIFIIFLQIGMTEMEIRKAVFVAITTAMRWPYENHDDLPPE